MKQTGKIDIVVSWLDESDKKWQESFSKYKNMESVEDSDVNSDARYRDYGTFKYWFRCIEKFAPWVNKIFLVTAGHFPDWLDKTVPNLCLVSHENFIPKEYLPTFSSVTICLNLHRIPGLSENFIYFNDDMFLVNKTKAEDFFKNNLPCDELAFYPANTQNDFDKVTINNMQLIHAAFTKKNIIKKNFRKIFSPKIGFQSLMSNILQLPYPAISTFAWFHSPYPSTKRNYQEIWEKYGKELNKTCLHKFRDINDVSDWFLRFYYLAKGEFFPKNMMKFYQITLLKNISEGQELFKTKRKVICFNDTEETDETKFEQSVHYLHKEFEKKFPQKSIYEI